MEEDRYLDRDVVRRKIRLHEIVIAELGDRFVGYLRLEYLWSRIPYVGLIRVDKRFRRRGIGRAILSFVENYLRRHGHKMLLSSSQVDEPIPSQAWHRAMGFEECGILLGVNEGGIGEIFFRKSLTQEKAWGRHYRINRTDTA